MQQNDHAKNAYENKFYCELHSECLCSSIDFSERQTIKSRFLCTKCMIDVINKQDKVQLICIQDLITNPAHSILKAARPSDNEVKIDEGEALEEIEKQLIKIEESFSKQLLILRQNIQQMKEQVVIMAMELYDHLKLDELVKQFELVGRLDSYQGKNEFSLLQEQLNFISANLTRVYDMAKDKVKDNQLLILDSYKNNFYTISNEVISIHKISLDLLTKIVTYGIPLNLFEDIYQFPLIHYQISEGKQIQYQLLYQGTKNGMNAQIYWSKCNQKSNLLTIMTSKNGNKFGGYSPCVTNNSQGFVSDPALKSFLFQYNKKEIYKLKISAKAVYCNAYYGPTYGGGHDLFVAEDFNTGYSKLGISYDISQYNIVDPTNHLFGAQEPQLKEIKVFKVLFQ